MGPIRPGQAAIFFALGWLVGPMVLAKVMPKKQS
jgi:hypothetical protein